MASSGAEFALQAPKIHPGVSVDLHADQDHLIGRAAGGAHVDHRVGGDTYRLMAWLFIAALVIVPFCKPAPGAITPPSGEH